MAILTIFFSRENQAALPALATTGKIRLGVEADLLHCQESDLPDSNSLNNSAPIPDATILDGAVVVQMRRAGTSKTFQEHGKKVFASYIYDREKQPLRPCLGCMKA